eukprot:COSAG06_NODE_83_length_25105_cov_69.740913_10_plen_115_part_00
MVMTQVALKYHDPEAEGKPFRYLVITFQECREQEIGDGEAHRKAQLFKEEDLGLSENKEMESRNKTRKFLLNSFEEIDCVLLPPPVLDTGTFLLSFCPPPRALLRIQAKTRFLS